MVQNEYINGNPTGRMLGYQVTRQLEVRTHRCRPGRATRRRPHRACSREGWLSSASLPSISTPKLPEIRGPLLADATRDAKARAGEIIGAVGASVGRIKGVRVGVFQVTRRNSTEVNDYGMYDTSDREKEITAVVRVTFALD